MYEYAPNSPKKRETCLLLMFILPAVLFYGCSYLPDIGFAWLYRLSALVLLVCAVAVVTRYLIRRYVYRAEPCADARGAVDLTVTEFLGKCATVVCRVSADDILDAVLVTPENRRSLTAQTRGHRTYDYTDRLYPQNRYRLSVLDGEETFYVYILADEKLLSFLKK